MLRGQEQLRCGCGIVTSIVQAPTGVCATAVIKSIMLCCSSTAVDNSPVVCARFLYFQVSGPTLAAGIEKKIRDPKFVARAPGMAGHVLQVNGD